MLSMVKCTGAVSLNRALSIACKGGGSILGEYGINFNPEQIVTSYYSRKGNETLTRL